MARIAISAKVSLMQVTHDKFVRGGLITIYLASPQTYTDPNGRSDRVWRAHVDQAEQNLNVPMVYPPSGILVMQVWSHEIRMPA